MKIHCDTDRYIREICDGEAYRFIFEMDTVIDIGACIGAFSFFIYDIAKKIYAIEPAGNNVVNLLKTVTENKLDKIIVKQLAISNTSVAKKMEKLGSAGGGGWRISESGTYPVDCLTLREFMDQEGIIEADLVKIDVEGHEWEILSAPFFPYERVRMIAGELHSSLAEEKKKEVVRLMEWMGYEVKVNDQDLFLARRG